MLINQSKLEETKQALISIEKDIKDLKPQKDLNQNLKITPNTLIPTFNPSLFKTFSNYSNKNDLVLDSINLLIEEYLKMAS